MVTQLQPDVRAYLHRDEQNALIEIRNLAVSP